MLRCAVTLAVSALLALSAFAVPFDIPVDPATSSIEVVVCVQGSCDTDTSPLTGIMTIELDSVDVPTLITLHDFDMQATQTLNHDISFWPFGNYSDTITGLRLIDATPGVPIGPAPVTGDAYALSNVPVQSEGSFNYTGTGIVCTEMQDCGKPCNDTRDLADEDTEYVNMSGTVVSSAGIVTLYNTGSFQRLLDEDCPDGGTIEFIWTVHGETYVPSPGDYDQDGDVDLNDFAYFPGCVTGPNNGPVSPQECAVFDFTPDDDIDLADFAAFQSAFTGPL